MGKQCFQQTGQCRSRQLIPSWLGVLFVSAVICAAADPAAKGAGQKDSLSWVGYYDPALNYLSAKALLQFGSPTSEHRIWLADGLQLDSVRGATTPAAGIRHDPGQYLLQGQDTKELEISYSGKLAAYPDTGLTFQDAETQPAEVQLDRFSFLSCVKNFYPHVGVDFGSILLNITVPKGWNCLGSGIRRKVQPLDGKTTYVFDNAGGKGMSLVVGHFSQIGSLQAAIPVRLHGWPNFNSNWYFPEADIARILTFYQERFGSLDLPELNILFQRGKRFGGVSYSGLVVLEVDASWTSFSMQTRKNIRSSSPLSFFDAKADVLSHELAHQWWGGLVSWKTPIENWITEGLATYSSLISLRAWRGEKVYRRALARLRDQVKSVAGLGAPADGSGFLLLNRDRKAYQSLVYGKPALMLAVLADRIGELEVCGRLRSILQDCRRSNLDTMEFLQLLAGGDGALLPMLKKWICARGLPQEI